jgi:hypothetical protein
MVEGAQWPECENESGECDAANTSKERLDHERRPALFRGLVQHPAGHPRGQTKKADRDLETCERPEQETGLRILEGMKEAPDDDSDQRRREDPSPDCDSENFVGD